MRRNSRNIAPKISICTNRDTDATMTKRGTTQLGIKFGPTFPWIFRVDKLRGRVHRGGDGLFLLGGNLLAAFHQIVRPFAQLASFALSIFLAFFGPLAQKLACFFAGFGSKENAHKGADPETYHEVTDSGSGAVAHLTNPHAAQPSTHVSWMQQSVRTATSGRWICFGCGARNMVAVKMFGNSHGHRPRHDAGEIFGAGEPHAGDASEFAKQLLHGSRTHAGNFVEFGLQGPARAALAVKANREAVRFIPDLLNQVQQGRVSFQADRFVLL